MFMKVKFSEKNQLFFMLNSYNFLSTESKIGFIRALNLEYGNSHKKKLKNQRN